ncbi:MAG: enoyl-CoA hydratase/isomerase family protein [Sphingobacteriaceae bacterium]|nr:enoyl-CoA hydratase/isomerase family protein [Sphingobacteriaceae bacterium]
MREFILFDIHKKIATITLYRPEKRNALNPQLIAEMTSAFKEAELSDEVKVVILKSSGDTFSAGADLAYLQQLQSNTYQQNLDDSIQLKLLFSAIYNLEKPVIAQVEGNAIAGGCGLVSVCDIVFAVPEAVFGYTEVKIGFVPAIVATFLINKIGEGRSRELLLSGELISAETAYQYGLVNFINEKSKIVDAVAAYAQMLILNTSSQSIKSTKALLAKIRHLSVDESLNYAARVNAEARLTDDCKKGIAAFLDKKHPKW